MIEIFGFISSLGGANNRVEVTVTKRQHHIHLKKKPDDKQSKGRYTCARNDLTFLIDYSEWCIMYRLSAGVADLNLVWKC
jgi:hypothetical protein